MKPGLGVFRRSLSSIIPRGAGVTGHPPLNEPFPGVISPTYQQSNVHSPKTTHISTLANGMRVATMNQAGGGMCSVGVVLESGSRFVSCCRPIHKELRATGYCYILKF